MKNIQLLTLGPAAMLLSIVFLISLMFTTNPQQLAAPLLLVPPILLFVFLFVGLHWTVHKINRIPHSWGRWLGLFGALGPTLLLLLASVGQLSVRDICLSAILVGGLVWYTVQQHTPQSA